VLNTGIATLTGAVITTPPFSIVSGAALSIPAGDSQMVVARFSPGLARAVVGNIVVVTDQGLETRRVTGSGTPRRFTLTVAIAGTGTGSVVSLPSGISCPADCVEAYDEGTVVGFGVTVAPGTVFEGWTGGGCAGSGACSVAMTAHRTVTAQLTAASPLGAFVIGFYTGALERTSDPTGLLEWEQFLSTHCDGTGFGTIARGFLDSIEFRTARRLSLTGLVTLLYRTFLGRPPDAAGLAVWADLFRRQRLELAVRGFIPSPEFLGLLPDRRDAVAVAAVVSRLYGQLLGRAPDPGGLAAWVSFIVGTGDLESAAVGFLTSREFESRPLTFQDYVAILYRTFLGREPDAAGLDAWEAFLRAGLIEVVDLGFVPSREFQGQRAALCP
jgi:Domain of unknown function (DUF4214)